MDLAQTETKRNKGGRPRSFNSPRQLEKVFEEYKKDCVENGFEVGRRIDAETGDVIEIQKKVRPLTKEGFCAFAKISNWTQFKDQYNPVDGFYTIIAQIENEIKSTQLEGAIVKFFDGNIVARYLGISDKQQVEVTEPPQTNISFVATKNSKK